MIHTARRLTLALALFALLAVPALAGDDAVEEVRHVQVKILDGDDLVDLDLSDLEVGESHQSYTANGTLVVATRNADDYTIQVGDDEEIVIPTADGMSLHISHDEEVDVDSDHRVVVRKHVASLSGKGSGNAVFISADGETHHVELGDGENHWVSAEASGAAHGVAHAIRLHGTDPAQHLIDSGVLDDLDEATRQKILDELRSLEGPHGEHKVIVRKKKNDNSDD